MAGDATWCSWGLMRRFVAFSAAEFLAVSVSVLVSLIAGSDAHLQASPDTYSQVVDNATEGRIEAPGWQTEPASSDAYGEGEE
jgi:hypothetical protein